MSNTMKMLGKYILTLEPKPIQTTNQESTCIVYATIIKIKSSIKTG